MQYLTFRLNGIEYAVDVRIIDSVVSHTSTMAVPSPIAYMRGVMNLRGRVIPVIDLRKKFGLPETQDASKASVIVFTVTDGQQRSLLVGALVDEVSEVLAVDSDRIETAQSDGIALWERYVSGIIRLDERMLVVIEGAGLLSLQELEALSAIPYTPKA